MVIQLLVSSVVIFAASYVLEGVQVKNFLHAILTAVLLAVANTLLKPVLVFFTLPITILSLGLFLIVINAVILMIMDAILPGLKIKSFWWAFSSILNWIF